MVNRAERQDVISDELILQNTLDDLLRMFAWLGSQKEKYGWNDRIYFHINLALEEIVTNIISYAFNDDSNHEIKVQMNLSPSFVEFIVIDDGMAINPLDTPQPDLKAGIADRPVGGLGLYLVRNVVDEICYERFGNNNVMRIKKKLSTQG